MFIQVVVVLLVWAYCVMPVGAQEVQQTQEAKQHKYTNKLIRSTSPFLLQHAHDPVFWYPWGKEALEKAERENKPVFVSVGYSSCYSCTAMRVHVFSKPQVAKVMNDNFVNILIDREEYPELEAYFRESAVVLKQPKTQWPNNVFLTPSLKPFYAGGYFPLADMEGAPGFPKVLDNVINRWQGDKGKLSALANKISRHLQATLQLYKEPAIYFKDSVKLPELVHASVKRNYDATYGGFYGAPKLPYVSYLRFLLNRYDLQKNPKDLEMVEHSVARMVTGGFYDHVGGGFHRYSRDVKWQVPYFEKLLYTQAELVELMADLYDATEDTLYKYMIDETLGYVSRMMISEEGGFYSAVDSQHKGIEGSSYVWEREELQSLLGNELYALIAKYFSFAKIPGKNAIHPVDGKVVYLKQPLKAIAKEEGKGFELLYQDIKRLKTSMAGVRGTLGQHNVDKKIIAGWNGMMIAAYARAGMVLGNPDYVGVAKKAAAFVLQSLRDEDGQLSHYYISGKAQGEALLEDYAYMAHGLLMLYRATRDDHYMQSAINLLNSAEVLFYDKKFGGYFDVTAAKYLPFRLKRAEDGELPSGNAVMLRNFIHLYLIGRDRAWFQNALNLVKTFMPEMKQKPIRYVHMIDGVMQLTRIDRQLLKDMMEQEEVDWENSFSNSKVDIVGVYKEERDVPVIGIVIDVEDGWYMYAETFEQLPFVPLTIAFAGGEVTKMVYPGKKEVVSELPEVNRSVATYQGKVGISAGLKEMVGEVGVQIKYQVCKEAVCLKPSTKELTLQKPEDKVLELDEGTISE